MKKLLIAVAMGLLIFGGQAAAEASTVDLDAQVIETQEQGKWSHFRDEYILNRKRDKHRDRYYDRDRHSGKEWKRRKDYDRRRNPPPPPRNGGYTMPPLPPPGFGAPAPMPAPGAPAPMPAPGAPPPRR